MTATHCPCAEAQTETHDFEDKAMNAEFRITQNAAMRPHPYERDERGIVMPAVSTHAALRYAERFLGMDLDEARRSVLTPDVVSAISAQPTGVVDTQYGRLVVNDGSVVAVLPANTPVPQKRPSVDGYRTPGLCQPVLEQQALLRYLEICRGVDVRAVHRAILSERVVQMIQFAQSGFVDTAAMRLVVVDLVVVTLYPRECADGRVCLLPRGRRKAGARRCHDAPPRRPNGVNPRLNDRGLRRERQTAAFFGAAR